MLTIRYEVNAENVEICPIADVHIGNPLCNEAEFKRVVDYVLSEPEDPNTARVCILNGDLTESVTRTSKGNVFDMTMTPSVQVATMVQYLLPLTETSKKYPMGKIISYCAGNHDEYRYKDTGISAAESIAVGLHLEDRYSTDGCYSFVFTDRKQCKGQKSVFSVYNQHMTGGGSTIGGKANRVAKISNGIVADIIIGSHVHTPLTFKEDIILPNAQKGTLQQKTITYLITSAFLRYGDYAQRNGLKPAAIAFPRVIVRQGRYQGNETRERYFYTETIL